MNELSKVLKAEIIQMPLLLESCIKKYITENQFMVYINPTEFSEHARTFKIIKTKKKDKRNLKPQIAT